MSTVYLTDWSNEIWIDIGQDSSTSIAEISFWAKNNLGLLNNAILTNFSIDSTTQEILPDGSFTEDEASIYKLIYLVKYYDKNIRDNLGAMAINSVSEYSEAGMSIKKFSRNEVAKTYLSLRKEITQQLKEAIHSYRLKKSVPLSIEGQEINQLIVYPSRYNRILNQGL